MYVLGQFYGRVDIPNAEYKKKRGARRPRKATEISPQKIAFLKGIGENTPFWHQGTITPISPLGRTPHPKSEWLDQQEEIKAQVKAKSAEDAPVCEIVSFNVRLRY